LTALLTTINGCKTAPAAPAPGAGMQAMPVTTQVVAVQSVQQSSDFVATIKSRRSVTIMPQVDGNITQILVKSGDHVRAGQTLVIIDPRHQQATVDAQLATEKQKKALFDYNTLQIDRQRKLFAAGIISRDALDQAEQAFRNTRADWESAIATRKSLEEQLAWYHVNAPFDGIVGDIPVHLGDYATSSTALTTLDENKDLEAYIYVPTERGPDVRNGLGVQLLDSTGKVLETTAVDFLSAQVDSQLQGILIKAPVRSNADALRTAQMVNARVIWRSETQPVVPVLAVVRQGGQAFVFLALQQPDGHFAAQQTAITLGETVANGYAVTSGVKAGDKVITSRTQYLVDKMPIVPMG
jgi:RND family efflux transporter MFP subunit